ncbi:MAG: hypothetical protein AB1846_14720 [Chloroflexota bacterium]
MPVCLNCNTSADEKPLLALAFKDQTLHICPQCLPVLIHKPANLAGKLEGAEHYGAPEEHHH